MDRAVTAFLVGFIAGVACGPLVGAGFVPLLLVLAASLLFLSFFLPSPRLRVGAFFCIALGFGLLWIVSVEARAHAPLPLGTQATFSGSLVEPPVAKEGSLRLVVRPVGATGTTPNLLVIAPRYPEFKVGDVLTLNATPTEAPRTFSGNDEGAPFRYRAYLAAHGIGGVVRFPRSVQLTATGSPSLRRGLADMHDRFVAAIARAVPEPEAGLLSGIALGGDGALPKEVNEEFRQAGISHIVVFSGYNLTIVSMILFGLLVWAPIRARVLVAVPALVAVAVLAGGGAATLRALLFSCVALVGAFFARAVDPLRVLLFVVALMLVIEPRLFASDPSFALSVLAFLGLVLLSDPLALVFARVPLLFRQTLVTTLAAQLFVGPYLVWSNGSLPLFALLSNLLALPLVPFALFFGVATGVVGAVVPVCAVPFALVGHALAAVLLLLGHTMGGPLFVPIPLTLSTPGMLGTLVLFLCGALLARRFARTMRDHPITHL